MFFDNQGKLANKPQTYPNPSKPDRFKSQVTEPFLTNLNIPNLIKPYQTYPELSEPLSQSFHS
jgi:hypothetical protein